MTPFLRITVCFGLLAAVASCAPDSPTIPLGVSERTPVSNDQPAAMPRTTGGDTVRLEIGRTALFEVGGRQYQRFVRYTSSDIGVANVSAEGVIKAIGAGTATVSGVFGTITETVTVVVAAPAANAPTVVSFAILPKYGASLAAGETQSFSVNALWSDSLPRAVSVTYHAAGGTVSPMGHYTAGNTAGLFLVIANCVCGLADTAYVRVGSAPVQLASLKISPKSVTLEPGASYQFTSLATWSTGDTLPPPRTFTATGGTVTNTGAFKAPSAPGIYRVIVAHTGGTLRDTATVTVGTIAANPEPPTLPPADTTTPWTLHEDFEGGVVGTKPPRFFGGSPPRSGTTYSAQQALSGQLSGRMSIAAGSDGWGHFGGNFTFPKRVYRGQTLRVRASFWMPEDFTPNQFNGDRLKFLRIHIYNGKNAHTGYLDLHYNWNAMTATNPYSWSYEAYGYKAPYWRNFGEGFPIRKREWETIEWAVTLDNVPMSEGGVARTLVWKNGSLVADIRDARTLADADGYATRFLIYTFWNNNAQKDAFIYIDDVTVTTQTPTRRDANGNPFLGANP